MIKELSNSKDSVLGFEISGKVTERFNEFRKVFPDMSQKMLSQQLKKLEENKIVEKKIFNVIPPKVEYRLTKQGEKLVPLLEGMQVWGQEYLVAFNKVD